MKAMIFEYIIEPIIEASDENISGIEILGKVALFLMALFALMYGVPMWMVALA